MLRAGKHVTNAKREEIHNQCQARENVYSAKRTGTFNQNGENFPVPSAGKHVTGVKRGKMGNRRFNAGKYVNCFKCRKTGDLLVT